MKAFRFPYLVFRLASLAAELAKEYEESKVKRIAAVYCDTPEHQKHLIAGWFGVSQYIPRMYYTRQLMHRW